MAEPKSDKQEAKPVVAAKAEGGDKKQDAPEGKTGSSGDKKSSSGISANKDGGSAWSHAVAKAKRSALRGGISGFVSMWVAVTTLMWMRTAINYSYAHGGTSMLKTLSTLWAQGGIRRFYAGYGWAMIQAPTSRFGDAAANSGVITLLEELEATKNLPLPVKTAAASTIGAGFRVLLMPIDALKTAAQSHGGSPLPLLSAKVKKDGPQVLFHGAMAAAAANWLGSVTWFGPYRFFDQNTDMWKKTDVLYQKLMRSMALGFCASIISDTTTNSIRVIKVVRQTSGETISYAGAVKKVIAEEGFKGLFGRGLSTKLASNGVQGMMFSVLWRLGQEKWDHWQKESEKKNKA
jgi:hypothetical protein